MQDRYRIDTVYRIENRDYRIVSYGEYDRTKMRSAKLL